MGGLAGPKPAEARACTRTLVLGSYGSHGRPHPDIMGDGTIMTMDGKNVPIVGGLGLIGSSTARYRISQGGSVTIANKRAPLYGANDFNMRDLEGKLELTVDDIREEQFVGRVVSDQQLGLKRRETVWSLSTVGVGSLRGAAPSTRGPEWTHRWCTGCIARCIAG